MAERTTQVTAEQLDALSPEQLATLPAVPLPPGIVPNFTNPPTRIADFFGASVPFLAITLACIIIRMYMKVAVLRKWRVEDTTVILGFLTALTFFTINAWGVVNGPIGKHDYDIPLGHVINRTGHMVVMCNTFLSLPALGFIKSTLFIQYYRLFNPNKWLRLCILGGLAITAVFYTAITIAYIALMAPWPGETFADVWLSKHWAEAYRIYLPPGIVGVVLDWYLIVLPIPAVMRLNLSIYKKIGVLSIFMTGGLAAVASIVSLYYRSQANGGLPDASWKIIDVTIWTQVELFFGIIAACMPTIHLYWHRHETLVSISSKVKDGMKSVLRKSMHSRASTEQRENVSGEKNLIARIRNSFEKHEESSDMPTDEILVSRTFGVSAENFHGRDSESTRIDSDFNFEDLEAQRPLPIQKPAPVARL